MLSEESNQRPKFLTVLDGFTNELPTFMLVTSSFDVCWGVPIIINSVLLSLSLSLFWSIHERTYLMHVSKTDIFSWISLFGLKSRVPILNETDYGCGTKIAFDLIVFQLRAWRSVPLREPRATQLCQFLFRNPEASLRQLLYIIRIKWKHAWKMDNCVIYTISISVVCSFAFETSRDLDPRNSSTPQWEEEVFIG